MFFLKRWRVECRMEKLVSREAHDLENAGSTPASAKNTIQMRNEWSTKELMAQIKQSADDTISAQKLNPMR